MKYHLKDPAKGPPRRWSAHNSFPRQKKGLERLRNQKGLERLRNQKGLERLRNQKGLERLRNQKELGERLRNQKELRTYLRYQNKDPKVPQVPVHLMAPAMV